jgi:hypothetical protein
VNKFIKAFKVVKLFLKTPVCIHKYMYGERETERVREIIPTVRLDG